MTALILLIGKMRYSTVVLLQHNWPDNLHLILSGGFPRCGCVKRFAVRCGGAWRSVGEEELWSLRSSHQQLAAGSRHEHVSTERRWVRRSPTWTHQMLVFPLADVRLHVSVLSGVCAVNNLLYVVGGDDGSCNLASVEFYNPTTDKWTLLPTCMSTGRSYAGQWARRAPHTMWLFPSFFKTLFFPK